MMTTLLPVVSLSVVLSAALTIRGHYLHPPRRLLIAIFKPLTTILIIAVAMLRGTFLTDLYARAILAGLVLSLIGDIFLVLPDRFLHGLGAFLIAQIAYIVAFHGGARSPAFPMVVLVLGGVAAGMLRYLWSGLSRELRGPVAVYVATIALMAALAVGRALAQLSMPAALAGLGAILFMCSDATLAVSRFRRPFRLAELVVLATYFAAQLLIALSV